MKKQIKQEAVTTQSSEEKSTDNSEAEIVKVPVVGIGASAGGLEALEQFFNNVPHNTGMAFVVIQHLDPHYKGILCEILQRTTEMKVFTVTDLMRIKPNCVYVIPSNTSMSILNNSLHLFEPMETRGLRLPIDLFFRSLAADRNKNSIGIILSGMGSDGSLGLKAIKESNGFVLVQDPSSSKYDSMPRSAIESVVVDIIAPPNELPSKLIKLLDQPFHEASIKESEKDSSSLEKIVILLRAQTGHDFSQYKKNTLYRRIERRMGIHQLSKIASYVRYLQENSSEIDILFKELLIGVTSFFRDSDVWDHLKEKVLPSLLSNCKQSYMLRAWIPACSTGEEAYSLAMTFKEVIDKLKPEINLSLQVFATDLDANAIEIARKGIYPANILGDVSQDRLNRFFTKNEDQYRVTNELREMIVFAPQNVIKDPPFTKLDILICRNLLIYLEPDLQKKLLSLFHYSLNNGGVLILGSAETNSAQSRLYTLVDSKLRIYMKSGFPKQEDLLDFPGSFSITKTNTGKNLTSTKVPDNIQSLTDQILLQQYSPSSVLVTDQGDILYITGSTGKYLEPAAGKANMNLFAMARKGLRNELPAAFRKAKQNYEKVVLNNILIGSNEHEYTIDVTLQQIEKPLALQGKILVIFTDASKMKVKQLKVRAKKHNSSDYETELENESLRLKEELQSAREEMQTSQEELKSTNEELQSTNEELQSTNEELTTSKEEMQSLNEELHTVNAELQSKVDDYARVNNDMNNLLNSIEIATLFLDRELKIRQFTVPSTKIFKLRSSDIGRLFTDQVNELDYPDLLNDSKEVLRTLIFVEKDVVTFDKRWYKIRIMPYRTFQDKIDGLVITFIDITNSKLLEIALKKSQLMLRGFIQTIPSAIISLSSDGSVIEFNPNAEKLLGRSRDKVIGQSFSKLFIPEKSINNLIEELKKIMNDSAENCFVSNIKNEKGEIIQIEWTVHKIFDEMGTEVDFIVFGSNLLE
jgi:two-component system, chemotaxis family, CheB/CheR fusion protein